MKVEDSNLLTTCITVAVVLSITVPSRSQQHMQGNEAKTSSKKHDSGQFPVLIGRYITIYVFVCCRIRYIFIAVEHYFVVMSCIFFLFY